jgi:hypothetical protein
LFVLQDAVFVVSNKGLDTNVESKNTGVYVYAKRVREITSSTSVDEIVKQYDLKNSELEKESAILEADPNSSKTKSKVFLLKDEVEFLRRAVTIIKGLKS